MLNRLFSNLQFQGQALSLRSERQTVLASNIANSDTPNYKARDFDFASALSKATGMPSATPTAGATSPVAPAIPVSVPTTSLVNGQLGLAASDGRHIGAAGGQTYSSTDARMQYRTPDQPSMDGNTVELDRERANFADNAVHYEATLKFINGNVRQILSAIKGE